MAKKIVPKSGKFVKKTAICGLLMLNEEFVGVNGMLMLNEEFVGVNGMLILS